MIVQFYATVESTDSSTYEGQAAMGGRNFEASLANLPEGVDRTRLECPTHQQPQQFERTRDTFKSRLPSIQSYLNDGYKPCRWGPLAHPKN